MSLDLDGIELAKEIAHAKREGNLEAWQAANMERLRAHVDAIRIRRSEYVASTKPASRKGGAPKVAPVTNIQSISFEDMGL
jgi:hypothetical protein